MLNEDLSLDPLQGVNAFKAPAGGGSIFFCGFRPPILAFLVVTPPPVSKLPIPPRGRYEPSCADAWWALVHHFTSVCLL